MGERERVIIAPRVLRIVQTRKTGMNKVIETWLLCIKIGMESLVLGTDRRFPHCSFLTQRSNPILENLKKQSTVKQHLIRRLEKTDKQQGCYPSLFK